MGYLAIDVSIFGKIVRWNMAPRTPMLYSYEQRKQAEKGKTGWGKRAGNAGITCGSRGAILTVCSKFNVPLMPGFCFGSSL